MNAGRRAGLEAALTRAWLTRGPLACALWPLSLLYAFVVALRRLAYRRGLLQIRRLPRPVIVVGNRIAGGAGKTPTVLALLGHLREAGRRPGVVARGHGGTAGGAVRLVAADAGAAEVGDEPLLIRLRGGAPVCVGADRVAAAEALLAAHPDVDILVADDGLQHLRLARDIELLVFDARGAGNGWLLPAGPLREPLDAPSHARHRLVLYNADAASTPLPGVLARRALRRAAALADWWRGGAATEAELRALRGRPLVACCGLAQPQRFFDGLRDAGLDITPLALPDHADYAVLPWRADAADVIVTEKDAVKLRPARVAAERPATRVWVAPLDFQPEPSLWSALDAALAAPQQERAWTPD